MNFKAGNLFKKASRYGISLILISFVMMAGLAYYQDTYFASELGAPAQPSAQPEPGSGPAKDRDNVSSLEKILLFLWGNIAIGFFCAGLLGIILGFKDWEYFFQRRIAEAIIERRYLSKLEADELAKLQVDTIKAALNVDDIDREGSLLFHYQDRIQKIIGSPYRENYDMTFILSIDRNRDPHYSQETYYKCRKMGPSIQRHIIWTVDPSMEREIDPYKLFLSCPSGNASDCTESLKAICGNEDNCGSFWKVKDEELDEHREENGRYRGWKYDLKRFSKFDGLQVKIAGHGRPSASSEMFGELMRYATKSYTVTVIYPDHLTLDYVCAGFSEEAHNTVIQRSPGYFRLHHSAWLFPNSGVIFTIHEHFGTPPHLADTEEGCLNITSA